MLPLPNKIIQNQGSGKKATAEPEADILISIFFRSYSMNFNLVHFKVLIILYSTTGSHITKLEILFMILLSFFPVKGV